MAMAFSEIFRSVFRLATAIALGALCLSAVGCAGNISTPLKEGEGTQPLEPENRAPRPMDRFDRHPETISVVTGSQPEYAWAHGRAFIKAPIDKVWEALQEVDVCADRRSVTRWSLKEEPKVLPPSYIIHNVVKQIITVAFDMTWLLEIAEGNEVQPQTVQVRFQKTEGTAYIRILAGSLVARRIDDSTTELELIEHINATGKGASTVETYLKDLFESIRAYAHGKPLPEY